MQRDVIETECSHEQEGFLFIKENPSPGGIFQVSAMISVLKKNNCPN